MGAHRARFAELLAQFDKNVVSIGRQTLQRAQDFLTCGQFSSSNIRSVAKGTTNVASVAGRQVTKSLSRLQGPGPVLERSLEQLMSLRRTILRQSCRRNCQQLQQKRDRLEMHCRRGATGAAGI